jgi:Sulfotransferase family
MSVQRRALEKLPPNVRLLSLHLMGRYAPWEPQFDFTPPALGPQESIGAPDFVGIGVQKAGTTWWFDRLSSHPDVTARSDIHKERHFFDRFGAASFGPADVTRYHGWFPRRKGTLVGEWTPDYFTFPWVPPLLQQAAPDARLLLMLRDPVERFSSGLNHHARTGRKADGTIIADAVQRGFYGPALSRWLDHYESERILVLQYERCVADSSGQFAATLDFLGLPRVASPDPDSASAVRASDKEVLTKDVKTRLVGIYSDDVVELASRVPEIDLTLWPNFAHLAKG